MEKRKAGNAPFYAAMAVCLLAAGVGTWQILKPEKGRDAVSASAPVAALPAQTTPLLPSAPADSRETDSVLDSRRADSALGSRETDSALDSRETDSAQDSREAARPASEELEALVPASGAAAVPEGVAASDGAASDTAGSTARKDAEKSGGVEKGHSGSSPAQSAARTVCSPLAGDTVAAFSMERLQYNKTLGDWRTHDGLDIAAELGTAVAAACDGTVSSVTEDPLMGVTVVLRHAGGYETTYAGLQAASRETGDEVAAGAMVGTVGDTAAAEAFLGPHLHFSVRHGGVPMDPEEFLSGA